MCIIDYNIGLKQPTGLERNLESFSVGKIWENPARIFCLSPVKSWERNEMEREPAGRYRAEGEGVFSSALRKLKSPILGWEEARAFLPSFF